MSGNFPAACGGKARCRSTQMYPKNRGVRKAVAKLGAEVHKKYLKIACTEGSGQTCCKSVATNKYLRWCSRFLSGFIVARTSLALRSFASLSPLPSPLPLPLSTRSVGAFGALQLPASRAARARGAPPARSTSFVVFFVVFSFVLFFYELP